MSFACRPVGLAPKRWDFVGTGALATGTGTVTAYFPATAQAGDLAVFCGSTGGGGNSPSGWGLIASGTLKHAYKACVGGETSASFAAGSLSCNACVLLFRPVGGAAALHAGETDAPTVNRSMSAGSNKALAVAIGIGPATTWSPTLPGSWAVEQNIGSNPSLYVAWRLMEPGESTGTMNLNFASGRQTFGIWGIT